MAEVVFKKPDKLTPRTEAQTLHFQILMAWAADLGQGEYKVSDLLTRAPISLLQLFLRVAADDEAPTKICRWTLGRWLAAHHGKPVAGWQLQRRLHLHQSLWRIVPATAAESIKPTRASPVAASTSSKALLDTSGSASEKLARNLDASLDVDAQILALDIDKEDPKTLRMIGEASGRTLSAAVRVDQNQLKRDDFRLRALDRLLGLLDTKYDSSGHMKVIEHAPD
jgi:hypothetical protein